MLRWIIKTSIIGTSLITSILLISLPLLGWVMPLYIFIPGLILIIIFGFLIGLLI